MGVVIGPRVFYFRYFNDIDVCKVRPDWREARIKCVLPHNSNSLVQLIKLTIAESTEVEIGMYQEGTR